MPHPPLALSTLTFDALPSRCRARPFRNQHMFGETTFNSQPIVIDNGSGIMKAGFAGDETPRCCIASYVGRPKHRKVMTELTNASVEGNDHFIGKRALDLRGLLRINYPMEHGIVTGTFKANQCLFRLG